MWKRKLHDSAAQPPSSGSPSTVAPATSGGASGSGTNPTTTTTPSQSSSSGNSSSTSAAPQLRFAYQSNLAGYQVNPTNGALTPIPATVTPLWGDPIGAPAGDPLGRFLYISYVQFEAEGTAYGQSGLQEFTINPATGELSEIPGSPLNISANLIINPSGTFLYAFTGTALSVYSIDQQSGALTLSSTQTPAFGNSVLPGGWMAMDPLGTVSFQRRRNIAGNEIDGRSNRPDHRRGDPVAPDRAKLSPIHWRSIPSANFSLCRGNQRPNSEPLPVVQSFVINWDGTLTSPVILAFRENFLGLWLFLSCGRCQWAISLCIGDFESTIRGYSIDPVTGAIAELAISPVVARRNHWRTNRTLFGTL